MTKRHTPPGRKSYACVVVVKPFGPHHCARCFGSVHTENTNARGASNTREPMIERGSRSRSILFFTVIVFLPAWFVSVGLAVSSGSRRADRAALPRVGDTPRAIGRLP